jgi:Fe-S cluster assembly ATP-binding protein
MKLEILNVHASLASSSKAGASAVSQPKEILNGVNLILNSKENEGSFHVLMGPNGVGKSTLGHVIMGNKNFICTQGKIILDGKEIQSLSTDERSRAGLFLAFQYPVAVPGLKVSEFLRNLYNMRHAKNLSVAEFRKIVRVEMEMLEIDRSVLGRYLNEGFSGGEMKRMEMLQIALAAPKVAILDEIDSGVDVDAQRIVASAISKIQASKGTTFLLITHYQRMLNFLSSDAVHVMLGGKIVKSGGVEIVQTLETTGYDAFRDSATTEAN